MEKHVGRTNEFRMERKMQEPEQKGQENQKDVLPNDIQNDFMIEKIKLRPVNKRKLLRRTIITASVALIFGLIACFTFLVLEPVISNWLYPEEEPQLVVFPEDQEEMSPEEMLLDTMTQERPEENTPEAEDADREQLEEIINDIMLNRENCQEYYYAMSEYVNEIKGYLVTVTGVSSNVDWFDNIEESKNQACGAIIADNGKELLILVDYTPLEDAETLTLTFQNGIKIDAQIKGIDASTNLAVLAVSKETLGSQKIVTLGSSVVKNAVGTPVVAIGSPMGIGDSVGYGMVTAVGAKQFAADADYKYLQTDIAGSRNASGFLFNLDGQIIGVITGNKLNSDMENMITAYGITELKRRIEKMSNGQKMAYLGIGGVDVTKEANEELGIPYGAYVTEVEMNSPAMLAGIQQGDVLTKIDGKAIFKYAEYIAFLNQMEAGKTVKVGVMRLGQDEYKEMKFEIVPQ